MKCDACGASLHTKPGDGRRVRVFCVECKTLPVMEREQMVRHRITEQGLSPSSHADDLRVRVVDPSTLARPSVAETGRPLRSAALEELVAQSRAAGAAARALLPDVPSPAVAVERDRVRKRVNAARPSRPRDRRKGQSQWREPIVGYLRTYGPSKKLRMADDLGIPRGSISAVCKALVEEGVVVCGGGLEPVRLPDQVWVAPPELSESAARQARRLRAKARMSRACMMAQQLQGKFNRETVESSLCHACCEDRRCVCACHRGELELISVPKMPLPLIHPQSVSKALESVTN